MVFVPISEGSKIVSPSTQTVYKLVCAVGHGSYGTVYQAKAGSSLKFVAVKVVDVSGMGEEVDTILQEVSLTQRAYEFSDGRCPKCIEAFALCLPGKFQRPKKYIVIVMDYIDGICLSELLLNDKPLNEILATYIIYEIAAALKGLHLNGMIHRDIKSSNVMISKEGGVYLCDFGVSKILSQHCAATSTMNGTPLWMAPEIIHEQPYNQAVDIYSLGVTAVELVLGHPPMPAASTFGQSANDSCSILHHLKSVSRLEPDLPIQVFTRFFRQLILRCLETEPKNRCTADEVLSSIYTEYNHVGFSEGHAPGLRMGSYNPKLSLTRLVIDHC